MESGKREAGIAPWHSCISGMAAVQKLTHLQLNQLNLSCLGSSNESFAWRECLPVSLLVDASGRVPFILPTHFGLWQIGVVCTRRVLRMQSGGLLLAGARP